MHLRYRPLSTNLTSFDNLKQNSARRGIHYTLDRLNHCLMALNNPHHSLPPTIHIAGTNGKGSVAHYLTKAFTEASFNVLTYTSPHILSYLERFQINGTSISMQQFDYLFDAAIAADTAHALSEYELLTIMAFIEASQQSYDILILETGLGGRLDATNVIPNSVAIITDIGMDHMDILGPDIASISHEKAGIIKPNSCVITHSDLHPDAQRVIETTAKNNSSSLYFTAPKQRLNDRNKALARRACELFTHPKKPSKTTLYNTIQMTSPPFGRLSACMYQGNTCWLDVGHNKAAAQRILNELSPSHWIIGMQAKKQPTHMIDWLLNQHQSVSFCGFDPLVGQSFQALPQHIQSLVSEWTIGDVILPNTLFFGSFYFVEALIKSPYTKRV